MELNEAQRRQVLDVAARLQEARERREEGAARMAGVRKAAEEVGLDPALIEEAEAIVRARTIERVRQVGRNRSIALAVGAAVALVAGAAAFHAATAPSPIVDDFSGGASRWALSASPGSRARVTIAEEAGRGEVARLTVEAFAPEADGTYRVNLDRALPEVNLARMEHLSLTMRGEGLTTVRVYLEGGDERWRSPALPVTADWTVRELDLDAFDHQRRSGDGWALVGLGGVDGARTLSVKLGHYVNAVDATGEIWIDDLRLE